MSQRKTIVLIGLGVVAVAALIIFVASRKDGIVPSEDALGDMVALEGEIVCLPYRDTSGPVTLECVFGLRTPGGVHFALRNLFDAAPPGLETGAAVRVAGTLQPPFADERYDIHGSIDVESVEPR